MGKKLFVGSIPFQATEEALSELFATIGEVESCKIIIDNQTGQSRGFGFVEMVSEEDAGRAIESLNGASFMERTIVVSEARPQQSREKRGGFGGGGGRGGFGGGGGRGGRGGSGGGGGRDKRGGRR